MEEEEKNLLSIYSDGSASHAGVCQSAYAFCIDHPKKRYCDAKSIGMATCNQAELHGVIEGIKFALKHNLIEGHEGLHVHTDSMYVVKGATAWMTGWKKNG